MTKRQEKEKNILGKAWQKKRKKRRIEGGRKEGRKKSGTQ